ncbi:RICIN domain-containing protein [Nonomuraea typhae]|uniref:RICIN domain-containing protein n=1 Tax=Nonomuraea typhae TaxID=2603600 RepID=A0ABW7Z9N8_9ACTN
MKRLWVAVLAGTALLATPVQSAHAGTGTAATAARSAQDVFNDCQSPRRIRVDRTNEYINVPDCAVTLKKDPWQEWGTTEPVGDKISACEAIGSTTYSRAKSVSHSFGFQLDFALKRPVGDLSNKLDGQIGPKLGYSVTWSDTKTWSTTATVDKYHTAWMEVRPKIAKAQFDLRADYGGGERYNFADATVKLPARESREDVVTTRQARMTHEEIERCGGGDQPGGAAVRHGLTGFLLSGSGRAMDLDHGNGNSGTKIQAYTANNSNPQKWGFYHKGGNIYVMETVLAKSMLVDLHPDNNRTHLIREHGGGNQRWEFRSIGDGWYQIKNQANPGCLTDVGHGNALEEHACRDGDMFQRWKIQPSAFTPDPRNGPGDGGPAHGKVVRLHSATGFAADLKGGNPGDGTIIHAANREAGNTNQDWVLWDKGGGNWLIETNYRGGGVMDVKPGGDNFVLPTGDWTLHLIRVHGGDNQLWRFEPAGNGFYRIRSVRGTNRFPAGGCLTASGPGETLHTQNCDQGDKQLWAIR